MSYESRPKPCNRLHLTILRGRNISVGKWSDRFDTPDPYVLIRIPTAPNGKSKTKIVDNNPNPVWNDHFEFYMDPSQRNILHLTLVEADIVFDDIIDNVTFDLSELKLGETLKKTFSFGTRGEVDSEMRIESCTDTDLRYSQELCNGEKEYLKKRKTIVFEAMKKVLGDRAPRSLDEVPNIALIGSGGGFRAMVGLTGAHAALVDTKIMDCTTYFGGLSGSTWWMSVLYSHPNFPDVDARQVISELRSNIENNWMWLLVNPRYLYKRIGNLTEKRKRGQPVSFTDFFGYLIGDTILKGRDQEPKLSEQRQKIEEGRAPFPIYTCIRVKKDVSALSFCEWVEFTPFEVGMAKYGAYEDTKSFGNKFFRGKIISKYPELPLHYLQGIWGSAFTILLQRMLNTDDNPLQTSQEIKIKGDGRAELMDMIDSGELSKEMADKSDDEDEDNDGDVYGNDDVCDNDDDDGASDNSAVKRTDRKEEESIIYSAMTKIFAFLVMPFTLLSDGYYHVFSSHPAELGQPEPTEIVDTLPELKENKKPVVKKKRTISRMQGEVEKGTYWTNLLKNMVDKFEVLRTRSGRAGLVHNYMRDLEVRLLTNSGDVTDGLTEQQTKSKKAFLVDSGLLFNSPFPPLLRPQRAVDMYISYDFSSRDKDEENPLKELGLAQEWARENNLPFPSFDIEETYEKEGMKECYVFKDPIDPCCPILVHFVLVNKTFKEYKQPGVKRETEEEEKESNFSLFEDPEDPYSTFNFHYPNKSFDRLSKLMEFNTHLCCDIIKDAMAECVVRRRNTLH